MKTPSVASSFLQRLTDNVQSTQIVEDIERWAEQGSYQRLYEVALVLEANGRAAGVDSSTIAYFFDLIVDVLVASSQKESVQVASLLALIPPKQVTGQRLNLATIRLRTVAQKVASIVPKDVLLDLFEDNSAVRNGSQYHEYLACLLQEMVLRQKRCEHVPSIQAFYDGLQQQRHPLAKIPPYLLKTEVILPRSVAKYHGRSVSHETPFGPHANVTLSKKMRTLSPQPLIFAAETTQEIRKQISAAFASWNELLDVPATEATIVSTSEPLLFEQITASLLRNCSLKCLEDAKDAQVDLWEVPASEVIRVLFAAAAYGAAYTSGHGGAYGRLEAWESMAGLSGCEFTDAETVESNVQECRGWWRFEADTRWFHQVAWDVGVVTLRPDRTTLAIVAASATD